MVPWSDPLRSGRRVRGMVLTARLEPPPGGWDIPRAVPLSVPRRRTSSPITTPRCSHGTTELPETGASGARGDFRQVGVLVGGEDLVVSQGPITEGATQVISAADRTILFHER